MTGSLWIPGLVVLAIGLIAGVLLARRFRLTSALPRGDLDLKISDLEARREELYQKLRANDLTADDRAALELAAARVLRELDQTRGAAGLPVPPGAPPPEAARSPEVAPMGVPRHGRWNGVIGFAAGVFVAGLIGLLVYWAGRDAEPGERAAPSPRGGMAAEMSGELPPDHPPIEPGPTAAEAEQLAALERRLAVDPSDLRARKEISLVQLSAGMYLEAFESADQVLTEIPEDPDGLFVQGVVRLTMGQNEEAVNLFDRVLARFPNHLQAMAYRGLGLYQSGQVERAVDTWEMGLEMAGGSSPQLEALLQMASQQPLPEFGASPAPPPTSRAGAPAAPTAETEPAAPSASSALGTAYRVRLDLAPGAQPQPGSVLFVALRPSAGGPPTAVRRIGSPRFPLEIELSQADSMMGGDLLDAGLLTARLDTDGSATTRGPGDLAAQVEAAVGDFVSLVLSPE